MLLQGVIHLLAIVLASQIKWLNEKHPGNADDSYQEQNKLNSLLVGVELFPKVFGIGIRGRLHHKHID